MEKATMKQTMAYLNTEKEKLQKICGEWSEDMKYRKEAIYKLMDRMPVDAYVEVENYIAYVDTLRKLLEEHQHSIEKWELSKVFVEENK